MNHQNIFWQQSIAIKKMNRCFIFCQGGDAALGKKFVKGTPIFLEKKKFFIAFSDMDRRKPFLLGDSIKNFGREGIGSVWSLPIDKMVFSFFQNLFCFLGFHKNFINSVFRNAEQLGK